MSREASRWTDERTEVLLARALRGGVVAAAAVMAVGAGVYLARHGGERPMYQVFRGEPGDLESVPGILRQAWRGSGRGLIQLGLLLLIATPVARVMLSVLTFALQRDRRYVVITLFVLMTLLYGLFGAG